MVVSLFATVGEHSDAKLENRGPVLCSLRCGSQPIRVRRNVNSFASTSGTVVQG
jgi:hypothetical protein